LVEKFFHRSGKSVIIPKNIIISHEKVVNITGSKSNNSVLTFNNKVKTIIEILNAKIIIYGLYFSFGFSTELPSIIGNNGKTHGANTVKTPARKETNKIVIYEILIYK
jgi:hypothetical protein